MLHFYITFHTELLDLSLDLESHSSSNISWNSNFLNSEAIIVYDTSFGSPLEFERLYRHLKTVEEFNLNVYLKGLVEASMKLVVEVLVGVLA